MEYYGNNDWRDYHLSHHGILGMKWGVRRFQPYSVKPRKSGESGKETGLAKRKDTTPRSTKRLAKKDAKEFARAKMFYGEGAGNRRKLINATVKQRSKDPAYKREFEAQLKRQDMAKHAAKARGERHRKDVAKSTVKTTRGVVNLALGNIGRVSAASAAIYYGAKVTGADKKVGAYLKELGRKGRDFYRMHRR